MLKARARLALLPAIVCVLSLAIPTRAVGPPQPEGQGTVVAVDVAQARVTLDHGPIHGVMPGMRMEFTVELAEALGALAPGDLVQFTLRSRGPEWVIAWIAKAAVPAVAGPVRFSAPDFSLPALSGQPLRLSSQRGKAVLLNFWATWCLPCRTEMPAIERLYQRHKAVGLKVIAINLDVLSTTGVEEFVKEVQVTFPILLDPGWLTVQSYRVLGLPTTYLIDRAGNVVVRELGARNWDDQASHAAVTKLLE